jgi:hypothetical protein
MNNEKIRFESCDKISRLALVVAFLSIFYESFTKIFQSEEKLINFCDKQIETNFNRKLIKQNFYQSSQISPFFESSD